MANYDDIFNASVQKDTEDMSFVSFNKEEWAAQKKQERESAFAKIDETAQRMANDGGLFQSYLDVQARFDRYSVGNAVLITAQKADATQLLDFKGWKNNGVYTKRFQVSFLWFFYFQTERWIDMPRMSKKRKQEWALFLNDRNRITYNELCRKCRNDCKQSFRCIVVLCPKYLSKRRTKKND